MDHLSRVYNDEIKRTRAAVRGHVERSWRTVPNFRDDQVQPFLDKVLPVVRAGQTRAVSLTSAYLSKKFQLAQPIGLDVDSLVGSAVRNGVDPSVVYARPFVTVRAAIYTIGISAAIEKGLSRLTSMADMDVMLSARDSLTQFAGKSEGRFLGYQRVADPNCCDFCTMLDGVKVASLDANPLHDRCECDVVALDSEAGFTPSDFTSLTAGSVIGDVKIEDHGELGPVITNKSDDFTSLADLPASYSQEVG